VNLIQNGDIASLYREGIELPLEQVIQVEEFATLALPTHPYALTSIEDAMPVQQDERSIPGVIRVLRVQIVDELYCKIDKRIGVVLARARDRVRQIGEQSEVQIRIRIRKEANFQFLHQFAHLLSLISNVGMATSVAHSAGIPFERSSLGSA